MERQIYTVTQVNEFVKELLEGFPAFRNLCVRGEISNFTNHYKSGHLYFTLKDETGVLRSVMFKYSAQRLTFEPQNGMKVLATGHLSSFVRDGQYQLYCDALEPDGIGALYLAYEQLKEKLRAEGLFDEAHKLPLPKCPLRVGIITSPTGAAVRDMIQVSGRRFPIAELFLCPVLVQGEGAAPQLKRAVRFFNESFPVDVILIGRGGGSLEDLWAFNDEGLAREIYASHIPVVSAVGHETDFTICDFVSDLRAPTPSAAAELALPEKTEMQQKIQNVQTLMQKTLLARIAAYRERVNGFAAKPCLQKPEGFLEERQMLLDRLSDSFFKSADIQLERKQTALRTLAGKLDALSPLGVFSRGYGAILTTDGRAVRSIAELSVDDQVTLKTTGGEADAKIVSIRKGS